MNQRREYPRVSIIYILYLQTVFSFKEPSSSPSDEQNNVIVVSLMQVHTHFPSFFRPYIHSFDSLFLSMSSHEFTIIN